MSVATATSLPTVKLVLPVGLQNDRSKEGWKLLEDAPIVGAPELELREFLHGEDYVTGTVMFDRAVAMGNRAGQQHAERLLAQQDSIPKEWRRYVLVFTGTKWQHSDGGLVVPCLDWGVVRWALYWDWLAGAWDDDFRLVCCK